MAGAAHSNVLPSAGGAAKAEPVIISTSSGEPSTHATAPPMHNAELTAPAPAQRSVSSEPLEQSIEPDGALARTKVLRSTVGPASAFMAT